MYHPQHTSSSSQYPSSVYGIQGQLLEVTVVGCTKLKDTEWISRQDPYVIVEYGGKKSRTRTCTDGGKNPVFQEKFVFTLIEGLRELDIVVWNSNTLTYDDFIGSGKAQLQKALSQGFDDTTWPIQTKTGRYAGEVRIIVHYPNANKQGTSFAPSAPPYATHPPHTSMYPTQPPVYPTQPPVSVSSYAPPPPAAYTTPSAYPSYPPNSGYPPSAYPAPHPQTAYPPSPYSAPSAYPPSSYPPPPNAAPYYPQGPFPGLYPPPPY
ncbi:Calcium-dependent lipid-binding (CaLB domain) family protein [Euphorbia peplus]|nr:Calcium-dependent lipid-binding (CaLB domain) family protein [Euphorbia peplus]